MSREMDPSMTAAYSGPQRPKLRERMRPSNWTPENRAKAATGMIWWQHAQTVAGTALVATGSVGVGVAILGLNAIQYPFLYKYRSNRREEAGLPPLKSKIFGRNKHSAHQEAAQDASVHQLPQRGTVFSAADRIAA